MFTLACLCYVTHTYMEYALYLGAMKVSLPDGGVDPRAPSNPFISTVTYIRGNDIYRSPVLTGNIILGLPAHAYNFACRRNNVTSLIPLKGKDVDWLEFAIQV